jgi:hypothetical protein
MDPVTHPSHNFTYKGPTEAIGDLSCERTTEDGTPVVFSHWQPTSEELEILNNGGFVKLAIWHMQPIPPVSVEAEA